MKLKKQDRIISSIIQQAQCPNNNMVLCMFDQMILVFFVLYSTWLPFWYKKDDIWKNISTLRFDYMYWSIEYYFRVLWRAANNSIVLLCRVRRLQLYELTIFAIFKHMKTKYDIANLQHALNNGVMVISNTSTF